MSLFDDLDALTRARVEREDAARQAAKTPETPRGRGRHRAPTPPWWVLRPAPRHQRRPAPGPPDDDAP